MIPRHLLTMMLFSGFILAGCGRYIQAEPVHDGAPVFVPPPVSEESSPSTPTIAPVANVPTTTNPPTPQAEASNTPQIAIFSEDPSLPRSRYEINAELDYDAHKVEVSQKLTYVNRSSEPLTEIVLLVEPARNPGAFQLEELTWTDGAPIPEFQLSDGKLKIPLPESLPPWKSLGLHLKFNLSLPARGGTFGYSERQMNLGDWYPFAPIYRPGAGWLAHSPAEVGIGEHLTYDIADFLVEVRLKNPPPDLILAASAPDETTGDVYSYQVLAARNFTLTASPHYEVIEDYTGQIPVKAYVFPEHITAGEAALAASGAALDLFSEVYGNVPRESLSIIEGEFTDGMEYDGLYFLSWSYFDDYFGGPLNFLTTLSVHETAHLWWAGLVASDQALEPWLDEALSTQSEKIYFERYHPDLVDWWWQFRIDLYEPDGWVNTTIYDHDEFRPYINAAYLRGVVFLEEAREILGDEAYFAALRAYLETNSYGDGIGEEFIIALEEQTDQSLDGLIEQYFR